MPAEASLENPYEKIKPRLHKRIGEELRLAQRVLDLGCGSCDLGHRRSQHGGSFDCLRQDATRLAFAPDRSVDAVVMMWALHEMDRPEAVLREVRRVLRPGGEVLIVDFPRDSPAQRIWNEDYYRPEEVRRLLGKVGLTDVRSRLVERGLVLWARGHQPPAWHELTTEVH